MLVRSKPNIEHKNVGPFLAFNNKFFDKHQRALLALLNHPLTKRWFRWVLRIRKDDIGYDREIVRLLSNAYHTKGDKPGEFIADFRAHPKYGKRIYYAFRPMWWAIHFWDWIWADRFAPQWSFGFSILTAYPDAGTGATTVDGYAARVAVGGEAFSTIRSGAGTTVSATGSGFGLINQISAHTSSNLFDQIYRSIFTFDTSSIGASATISAAEIDLNYDGGATGLTVSGVNIDHVSPAANNSLAASDFNIANWDNVAQATAVNSFTANTYAVFTLNVTGRGNISKTGISRFGSRINNDLVNSAPTWVSGQDGEHDFTGADNAGTTKDPKLVVTYSTATNVTVSPTVQSAALSLIAAAVILGTTIAPTVRSSSFSIQAPTVRTDQKMTLAAQSATFSLQPATFTNDTSATVTPSVQSSSFSIQSPSVATDQVNSVSAQALTASLGATVVSGGSVTAPNAQTAALSIADPSIALDSVLSPSVQQLTFSFPSSVVSIGQSIQPNAQALTLSSPTPGVSTGTTYLVSVETLSFVMNALLRGGSLWQAELKPTTVWSAKNKPSTVWTPEAKPST